MARGTGCCATDPDGAVTGAASRRAARHREDLVSKAEANARKAASAPVAQGSVCVYGALVSNLMTAGSQSREETLHRTVSSSQKV